MVVSGLAPRTVGGQIRGRITLDGEDVDAWPMHRLSQRIGIGFQNPATQLSQVTETVFEEVAFGPMNLALPRDEVIERTWAALAVLRIDDLAERDPRRLSGGQQQLVAMAGLLAMRPEHLVLDEPTAQLDPAGTRLVGDAVARLAADGASILVAEQKTDLLGAICSRVVVLGGRARRSQRACERRARRSPLARPGCGRTVGRAAATRGEGRRGGQRAPGRGPRR